MKKITRVFIAVSLLSILLGCGQEIVGFDTAYYTNADPHPDNSSHLHSADFQAVLDESVRNGLLGVSVLIRDEDGTWAGSAGWADLSTSVPLDANDLTRIGSISKTFTAVTLLRLQEQSLIDLDDTISSHLSSDTLRDIPNTDTVTVRQLMNHTSGIPNYTETFSYLFNTLQSESNHYSSEECLDLVRNLKPLSAPGEKFYYSNTNYVLAGLIIDQVSDADTDDTIRELVTTQIGLDSTFFDPAIPTPSGLVQGYHDWYGDRFFQNVTEAEVGMETPDGGFVSNVYDLHDFILAVSDPAFSFLSTDSYNEMITPGVDNTRMDGIPAYIDEMEYGLGYFRVLVDGIWWEGHAGSNYGYRSLVLRCPSKDYSFIYASNCNFGVALPLLDDMTIEIIEMMNTIP